MSANTQTTQDYHDDVPRLSHGFAAGTVPQTDADQADAEHLLLMDEPEATVPAERADTLAAPVDDLEDEEEEARLEWDIMVRERAEAREEDPSDYGDEDVMEWAIRGIEADAAKMAAMTCYICYDDGDTVELLHLTCGEHAMCTGCLRDGVRAVVHSEELYPLKCGGDTCQSVADEVLELELYTGTDADRKLLKRFRNKVEEYGMQPALFRTYCQNPACHLALGYTRFINHKIFGDESRIFCPDCDSASCRRCAKLVEDSSTHLCQPDENLAKMDDFRASLPEEQRWLWQTCPHCRNLVEKSEACNHIECLCGKAFCLICGGDWVGLASCPKGCPKYAKAVYDSEGYNQRGFHKITGLDRLGNPAYPDTEDDGEDDRFVVLQIVARLENMFHEVNEELEEPGIGRLQG